MLTVINNKGNVSKPGNAVTAEAAPLPAFCLLLPPAHGQPSQRSVPSAAKTFHGLN